MSLYQPLWGTPPRPSHPPGPSGGRWLAQHAVLPAESQLCGETSSSAHKPIGFPSEPTSLPSHSHAGELRPPDGSELPADSQSHGQWVPCTCSPVCSRGSLPASSPITSFTLLDSSCAPSVCNVIRPRLQLSSQKQCSHGSHSYRSCRLMPTLGGGSKALTKWDTYHLHCLYGCLLKHYPGLGVTNILVTEYQTEISFNKERKKKKVVKIELAGNQRPQEEPAYRKSPSSVTRWESFSHVLHGSCRDRMVVHTHGNVLLRDNLD